MRSYAEGSTATAVPYIEGWFVDVDLRRLGIGRRLVEAAENWARENGYREIASDALLENETSIQAHARLGFEETDRIVCFLKPLPS